MKSFFTRVASVSVRLWVPKACLILLAIVMLAIFLMTGRLAASIGQRQEVRQFEDAVPTDVPIKIRIKKEKEKSFRDLDNEKWLSDFELELTNTGNKPIYFVYLTLITDVKVGDQRLVFPQAYGRAELGNIVTPAMLNDVPIKPGDTYVFKIGPVPAWERAIRDHRFAQPRRIRAELQSLSFGDGTGYFGNHPYHSMMH
ncbi:MAG: hypothetical protein JWM21_1672 [Acidobacteria bacterium]|nr:hypothetical protein [Acidobacteriota bacterium]